MSLRIRHFLTIKIIISILKYHRHSKKNQPSKLPPLLKLRFKIMNLQKLSAFSLHTHLKTFLKCNKRKEDESNFLFAQKNNPHVALQHSIVMRTNSCEKAI